MNFLLSFFRGKNVWVTSGNILIFGSGLVQNADQDNKGTDDVVAQIMLSSGEGLQAYGQGNYNLAGKLLDGIIIALQNLKQSWIDSGLIKPVDSK